MLTIPFVYTYTMNAMIETHQTTETGASRPATTREQLVKVNVPCLYRHANGTYYGIKKFAGKIKTRSLETQDRRISERRLKDWLASLNQIDTEAERTTLRQLIDKLLASRAGLAPKTVQTETWLADTLRGNLG